MTVIQDKLKERAERDYALLSSVGLTTGETWFPPGTEAVAGRSAIKRAREAFEELPTAYDALTMLSNVVESEYRSNLDATFGKGPTEAVGLPRAELYPGLNGGLVHYQPAFDGEPAETTHLLPTDRAMQQMVVRKPDGHPAAQWDINSWLGDAEKKKVIARTRALPESRRVEGHAATREIYAMVSPDYVPYDIDQAADDLLEVCPDGSRARVRYDGARARVDIVLQNPYRLEGRDAAGVGETHRVVLRMKTTDDGTGGYHLSLLAERVRCINLSLLHTGKSLLKATHRTDNLQGLAQQALEKVGPLMASFAKTWEQSWNEYYADKHTRDVISGAESLRRIVALSKFRITGLGEDGTLAAVLRALDEEPGDTKAHVHNAMTRAAHTASVGWQSRWADDDAEEAASNLLYQHVSWLPEVEA